MSRSKTAAATSEELPFEEALKKLEAIVEAMEADELPLEQLLERYTEGTKLATRCQELLSAAELKLQRLEQGTSGEPVLEPVASAVEMGE